MSNTIPMTRDEPPHPGGPVTADVHPAEVAGMEACGWRVMETDPEPQSQDAPEAPESVAFDVATATKAQLEDFAATRFGVNLDKRKRLDTLRDEVRGLIDGG